MRPSILKMTITFIFGIMMSLLSVNIAMAAIDVYEFDTPQQEAQYRGLIAEFRCPKCQNQNLAGSDAPIAQDLKQKTYEMVKAGQTDAQIREYMYDRYGDFISYKPPVRPSTWILWFFPPALLVLLIAGWVWLTKKNSQLALAAGTATPHQHITVSSINDNNRSSSVDTIKGNEQQPTSTTAKSVSKLSPQEEQALAELLAMDDQPAVSEDMVKVYTDKSNKGDNL